MTATRPLVESCACGGPEHMAQQTVVLIRLITNLWKRYKTWELGPWKKLQYIVLFWWSRQTLFNNFTEWQNKPRCYLSVAFIHLNILTLSMQSFSLRHLSLAHSGCYMYAHCVPRNVVDLRHFTSLPLTLEQPCWYMYMYHVYFKSERSFHVEFETRIITHDYTYMSSNFSWVEFSFK